MLGGGRVVPAGVTPRLITLPITAEGIDDSALVALSESGQVSYLEREILSNVEAEGLIKQEADTLLAACTLCFSKKSE